MRVSTPPRLTARVASFMEFMRVRPASSPPFTPKEMIAPPPDICRRASSYCGWLGRNG
jgi:hypothetical protein